MSIKVLIGCRINLLAEGLKCLFAEDDEIRIIGRAFSKDDLKLELQLGPDLLVADAHLCEAMFNLYPEKSPIKILLLNDQDEAFVYCGDLQEMVTKGLSGILPNTADGPLLKKAITSVHEGDLWIDHKTIKNSLSCRPASKKTVNMTKREAEIFHYVCSGYTNRETAQKLCISEQTVKSHCNRLFKKFGVTSRVKLTLCANQTAPRPFDN